MKKNAAGVELHNEKVVEKLNKLLADYQIHYQNLRGFHWNIKGRSFFTLHAIFEQYYNEAAERVDELAERILMLGGTPLHTFKDYLDNTSLKVYENVSDADKATTSLLNDIKYLLKSHRETIEIAEKAGDDVTVDMMTGYNGADEKKVWMLSAYLA